MDNKGRNTPQMQSSLLFKLPNSVLSFSDMNTNSVLMPVAVDPNEEVQSFSQKKNMSEKSNLQSKTSSIAPKSICQLEQPLLLKKGSKPVVDFLSQVSPESQTSSYIGPPVKEYAEASISTNVENSPISIAQQPCPGYEESFSECPHLERASSLSSGNETMNFGPLPGSSSAPVFYPVSSTSHVTAPPSFSPRLCGEPYGFVSSVHQEASIPNSEDPKLQQLTPDVFSQSSHQQSVFNSDYHKESHNCDYAPVEPYWLFEDIVESKEIWYGFSEKDSQILEMAHQTGQSVVSTDGGRFDVHLQRRVKMSVYFDAKDMRVRRGSWFYETGSSMRYRPYEEQVAEILEQHYLSCFNSGHWQRRFNISGVGSFVFESEQVMLHYKNELEVWPSLIDNKDSPKAVKRGLPDGFEIMPHENFQLDHLVFIVQGIGSFCDLRFRTVSQCVDGFRDIANKLVATHFKNEVEQRQVGRVEFLPVAWHAKLHTSEMGLDRRMQNITLPSIPKLRHFTNDTLLDILLYSNQSYCQSIIDTVASELNRLYELFLSRNPLFSGKVFVAGHSLGSLILFDILSNQVPLDSVAPSKNSVFFDSDQKKLYNDFGMGSASCNDVNTENMESLLDYLDLKDCIEILKNERIDYKTMVLLTEEDLEKLSIPLGPRKKLLRLIASEQTPVKSFLTELISSGLGSVKHIVSEQLVEDPRPRAYPAKTFISSMSLIAYPRLQFQPAGFFALGSPISMFLAARGYDSICEDFQFPTCPAFFHIFHPYDPVAFRIEPLIDPNFTAKPVLIPHHKGRKRMHLEIRENVTKIATEIKQKLMDTMRYTWNSLSEFAKNHSFPSAMIEAEVDKLVNQEMSEPVDTLAETSTEDIEIGLLNGGRRIDFVLQEKPIEALNDYVFALTSHATYWDSEDTVLMILREIYAMQGIVMTTQHVEDKPLQTRIPTEENVSIGFIETPNQSDKIFDTPQSTNSEPSRESSPHIISTSINDVACTGASSVINSQSLSAIPGSKHIGPPPLSGFVKRSPFMR